MEKLKSMLAVLCLCSGLLLMACGDDDGGGDDPTPSNGGMTATIGGVSFEAETVTALKATDDDGVTVIQVSGHNMATDQSFTITIEDIDAIGTYNIDELNGSQLYYNNSDGLHIVLDDAGSIKVSKLESEKIEGTFDVVLSSINDNSKKVSASGSFKVNSIIE